MICYHHNDADGVCAAAVVQMHDDDPEGARFIESDYNRPLQETPVSPGERIYIVDWSPGREEMVKLLQSKGEVIWIDHHKTAIEKLAGLEQRGQKIKGSRSIHASGCWLTWNYLFPATPMPWVVEVIDRYDRWQHTPDDEAIVTALMAQANSMLRWLDFLGDVDGDLREDITRVGNIMLSYRRGYYAQLAKLAYPTEFEGMSAIACNAARVNSRLFDSIPHNGEVLIAYYHDGEKWVVSLYEGDGRDLGQLAKRYGGGGHARAAGFSCRELPFEKEAV